MRIGFFFRFAMAVALLAGAVGARAAAPVRVAPADVSWRKFLARHDMYWSSIGTDYYGGAILGNGLLGLNIYEEVGSQYRFNIGRTDVTEGRNMLPGYESNSHLFTAARLPIGYFRLTTKSAVTKEEMRLSIYDAIASGTLTTAGGSIAFKTYVHAAKNYVVMEAATTGSEADFGWTFVPQVAVSPRVQSNGSGERAYYSAHPNPAVKPLKEEDGYHFSVQNLVCGKTYVVAWKELPSGTGAGRRVIATVSQEGVEGAEVGTGEAEAIASAKRDIDEGVADIAAATAEASHTAWWHSYYPQSFATFGNAKMESFYWLQLYKFACASRPDKPMVDIQGPWPVANTPWPCIWMNLNTQLTYSWQYKANQSAMSEPLWRALADNDANLTRNVTDIKGQEAWTDAIAMSRSATYNLYRPLDPALAADNQYETGNMTWLLFYYHQWCTYNHREDVLTGHFFDLLTRAINLYFHIRTAGADGMYHLPPTASPEYGSPGPSDCNYDLASLRWGLQTLIEIDSTYSLGSAKAAGWQDFLDKLAPYPEDATRGYMLGAGRNFTASHRHYSHMLMMYPYFMVNWDRASDRDVMTRTISNWQGLTGQLQGYSFTGSAAMYASMGQPETALARLTSLVGSGTSPGGYIRKNTLYKESGPVFETPMAAVSAMHELYLQTWGNKLRVFPAVPSAWQSKPLSFINLRTEGAFLISAARSNGRTVFVQVESEAGGMCRLQTGMDLDSTEVVSLSGNAVLYTLVDKAAGLIEVSTVAGDIFQLRATNAEVVLPAILEHPAAERNAYGSGNPGEAPEVEVGT